MKPDIAEAARFLRALDPEATGFTFQTFVDRPNATVRLARVLHGPLDRHTATLARLNAAGAGVFVTINRTDLRGRKTENVTGVRAVFVDLDGAPLEPALQAPSHPQIVVESSPGKFHVYWLVRGMPLQQFAGVQRALAERFGGDASVTDLPRVLRLPGFIHCKGEPFVSRIIAASNAAPYSAAIFGNVPSEPRRPKATGEHWGMLTAGDLEQILSALSARDFVDEWFTLMCAAYHLTAGSEEAAGAWAAWSAGNPAFAGQGQEVRRRWRSLKGGRGVGVGTMIWALRDVGAEIDAQALQQLADEWDDAALAELNSPANIKRTDAIQGSAT